MIVDLRVFEGGLTVKSSSEVEVNGERWKVRDVSMRSCLRRTSGVQVPAVGAGAQIDEAAATSATDIISSHCSEDNFMEEEQRRAFAGERNG